MEFNKTDLDKEKWKTFHKPEIVQELHMEKKNLQGKMLALIDETKDYLEKNRNEIELIKNIYSAEYICQDLKDYTNELIRKHQLVEDVYEKIANINLLLLDVTTYAYSIFLANDEWEWRAYARHLLTILYEHRKSVSVNLNGVICKITDNLGNQCNLESFKDKKKRLRKFIEKYSSYAKEIRVNVDAHFDGKFEDRLKLIETMSYYDIMKITKGYVDIILELMPEVRRVQDALQKDLDNSMSKFENQWIRYLNSEMLRNKSEMI